MQTKPARGIGSTILTLAICAFVGACLTAKWSPVQAADTPPAKKKASAAEKKQQKAKLPAAPAFRPIPATGTKVDATALAKIIDEEIGHVLKTEKVQSSPRSDDAEFLRRVHLDLVGTIPPPEKVREFLAS